MSTRHYLVFLGARASLSSEVATLEKGFAHVRVISPAISKRMAELSYEAIRRAAERLYEAMRADSPQTQPARLSVWAYEHSSAEELNAIYDFFGKAAWIELIPRELQHKDRKTREHIEKRLNITESSLHKISGQIYGGRRTSPLPLPISNFKSEITRILGSLWYLNLSAQDLEKKIRSLSDSYHRLKAKSSLQYKDDRDLIFTPSENGECHGRAHPTGNTQSAFINGRFRFGAALYAGFHFDVKSAKSDTLNVTLVDSDGNARPMKSEKCKYINIFPNDHLLPEKSRA